MLLGGSPPPQRREALAWLSELVAARYGPLPRDPLPPPSAAAAAAGAPLAQAGGGSEAMSESEGGGSESEGSEEEGPGALVGSDVEIYSEDLAMFEESEESGDSEEVEFEEES